MALENVPWAVTGAEVTAAVARQQLFDSTSGAEGVSSIGAMKVQALQTPGPKVRIAPGGATLNNRYTGGAGQSYSARNATQTEIPITATGSAGGRTDLVVLRILDPEFEGQAPENPDEFSYTRISVIEGVSTAIKSARDLNLAYPAIALARITIPASTATITNAMITDLRVKANPRTHEVTRPKAAVVSSAETLSALRENGEWFPNAGGEQRIDIPEWATRMQIMAEWIMIEERSGNTYGRCWVEYGAGVGGLNGTQDREYSTQKFGWNAPNTNDWKASNWKVWDEVPVPTKLRGTNQAFIMKANMAENFPNDSRPRITPLSGTALVVKFFEVADSSTT